MAQGDVLRVLVAEDDDTSFFILRTLLSKEPALSLERAVDGNDVFAKYKAAPDSYELIFMDVEMPNCDGIDAAKLIRQWEQDNDHAPILIIALTAHDEEEYIQKIYDAKMNDLIEKPLKRPQLLAALQKARDSKPTAIPEERNLPRNDELTAELAAALSDVIQRLWTDLAQYVKKINEALELSDAESIQRLGHTIKGFGGNLKHWRVTELGKAIQLAAIDRKFGEIKQLNSELLAYINEHEATATARFMPPIPQPSPFATPQSLPAPSPMTPGIQQGLAEMGGVVQALRARFLQDLHTDLVRIKTALDANEFETIRRTGHILKGVGGNLGHATVTDIGRAIQVAAIERDVEQIKKLVLELESYIRVVEQSDAQDTFSSELMQGLQALQMQPPAPRPVSPTLAGAPDGGPTGVQLFQQTVKATYVKDLPTHLDAILVAVDSAAYDTLVQVATSLEKAASKIHEKKIQQLAVDLRVAAEKQVLEEVERITEQLKNHLELVSL